MKVVTKQTLSFEDAERLKSIRDYIASNLDKKLSATILADKFDIGEWTVRRHFKSYIGVPLHAFIKESRMQAAMTLILKQVPVKRIISLIGYKSRTTFTHAFTKRFGNSPLFYLRAPDTAIEQSQRSFAQN